MKLLKSTSFFIISFSILVSILSYKKVDNIDLNSDKIIIKKRAESISFAPYLISNENKYIQLKTISPINAGLYHHHKCD